MAWLGFTSGAPCGGRSSFRLTPGASSWMRWASCWQSTLFRSGAVGSIFIGTKASWSAGTRSSQSGFGHQYAKEMSLPSGQRSTEWVARLPNVVAALNGEVTRLTGKKPSDAIKAKTVAQKPSSVVPDRPVGLKEQKVPSGFGVRYLYQPSGRRRATDPVWFLEVHRLGHSVTKPDEPVLYDLQDGPPRGFVREELLVVPPDTQLPPDGVLKSWALLLLYFGCTRDRSAWRYHGCGPRSCRTCRHWTAGCPLAGKPIRARCCTRHSDCSGPPSVLGCDQPSG